MLEDMKYQKKRLEYRQKNLESFVDLYEFSKFNYNYENKTSVNELNSKTRKTQRLFHFYGYDDENKLFERFLDSILKSNIKSLNQTTTEILALIRKRLRKELNIK